MTSLILVTGGTGTLGSHVVPRLLEARIKKIDSGSSAEHAGLKPDDVILSVNGEAFSNLKEFRDAWGCKDGDGMVRPADQLARIW